MKYLVLLLALLLLVGCGSSESASVETDAPTEEAPIAEVEETVDEAEFVSEDDIDLGELV